jgi:hypothetical protein
MWRNLPPIFMGAAANYRCYASILSSLTVQNWFVPLRATAGASAALIRYGEKGTRAGTGVGRSALDFARNSASRRTCAPLLSLTRSAVPRTGKRGCGISGGARLAPPSSFRAKSGARWCNRSDCPLDSFAAPSAPDTCSRQRAYYNKFLNTTILARRVLIYVTATHTFRAI